MKISLVVAASENHAIGKDNQLLWHLPKDMRFFKNTTWALPILMGRKTFESLGNKPLPGRLNIVITRQTGVQYDGATVVGSLEEAIEVSKQNDYNELMVIGGGEIYTRVHTTIDGDTYFPVLGNEWIKESSDPQMADEKHAFNFDFEIWQRK